MSQPLERQVRSSDHSPDGHSVWRLVFGIGFGGGFGISFGIGLGLILGLVRKRFWDRFRDGFWDRFRDRFWDCFGIGFGALFIHLYSALDTGALKVSNKLQRPIFTNYQV